MTLTLPDLRPRTSGACNAVGNLGGTMTITLKATAMRQLIIRIIGPTALLLKPQITTGSVTMLCYKI